MDTERHSETQRHTDRGTQRDTQSTETQRHTETQRDTERHPETQTHTERHRETGTERHSKSFRTPCAMASIKQQAQKHTTLSKQWTFTQADAQRIVAQWLLSSLTRPALN